MLAQPSMGRMLTATARHPGIVPNLVVARAAVPGTRTRRRTSARASATPVAAEEISVWLPTQIAERNIQLEVVPLGKGQAIVVSKVEAGSEAAQAGIVRGQKLVGLSDPVRDTEVWDMGDRPSLRFVRDAMKLRRQGQIQLVLQDWLNLSDPAYAPGTQPLGSDPTSMGVTATGSMASSDGEDGSGMTIGERMAAEYEAREAARQKVSEVNKRIQKRAAYMDEVSERNDAPFFALVGLAFLGPALIILAVAAGSGYLDQLYTSSMTIR
mmetsp:Transcript_28172/g.71821  ORF Transcript_28172/g.71821 Transcript_28172/m.71821 type:complete len:268 (-) Transcript_28172:332-1135(-)